MPTRYHRSTGTAYEVPARTTTRKRNVEKPKKTNNTAKSDRNVRHDPYATTINASRIAFARSSSNKDVSDRGNNTSSGTDTHVRHDPYAININSDRVAFANSKRGGNTGSGYKNSSATDKNVRHDPYATSVTSDRVSFARSTQKRDTTTRKRENLSASDKEQIKNIRTKLRMDKATIRQWNDVLKMDDPNYMKLTKEERKELLLNAANGRKGWVEFKDLSERIKETLNSRKRGGNPSNATDVQAPVQAAPAAPAKVSDKVGNTPAKSNKPTTHTIAQGETLSSIAKKYGTDWRQIAKDNGIEDPNMIIAGRKLNINGSTKTPKRNKPRRSMRTTPAADTRTLINTSIPPVTPSMDVAVSYPGVREGIRTPEEILGGF